MNKNLDNKQEKNMIKRLILLICCVLILSSVNTYADEDIHVKINGKLITFDVQPKLIKNRVLLPMRKIFETLGAKIEWDDKTKTVTAFKGSTKIIIKSDSEDAIVNEKHVTLLAPATIIDGRMLVPVRFVSESLGVSVNWDNNNKTVLLDE